MDVSIVVPAYNMERWLERAVRAAQATQGVSYEILIVDDGSTDATLALARRFAEADPSIRVIEMDQNRGLSAARNAGIVASRGTRVAHLGADDWWLPERLERLTEVGTSLGADVVADDNLLIYDGSDAPWARMLTQYGEANTEPYFITPEYFAARHCHFRLAFRSYAAAARKGHRPRFLIDGLRAVSRSVALGALPSGVRSRLREARAAVHASRIAP